MSYKVNTTVNIHKAPQENTGNMLTVLTFVDSKSNLSKSGFSYISSLSEFERVFADKYTEYSDTLKQAVRTLCFGYNILTYNVRKCQHVESTRISVSGTNFVSRWFDTELPVEQFLTTLHSNKNLAVKFKLSDFTEGKYLLLEHTINGKASNLYVGAFKDGAPIISSINYSNVPAPHEFTPTGNTEQDILKLKDILTKQEDYLMSYTNDGYVHLMFPYEFDTLGAGSVNRVSLEYDDAFMYNYINNVLDHQKIMDIVSTYNSDIEDLAVDFHVDKNNVYYIDVYKYQNENTIIATENYFGTDFDELIQAVNGNSQYVRLTVYRKIFPVGKFRLQQLHAIDETPINYEEKILEVKQLMSDDEYLNTNIILEPDLQVDHITHIKIQNAINNVFDDPRNMCIKLFTYYGTSDDILSCYVDDSEFLYDGVFYNTKMLLLKQLVLGQSLIKANEIYLIEKRTKDEPFYVNSPKVGFKYVTFDAIKTIFNKKYYNIYDMLVISCVNSQVNTSPAEKNRFYFYNLTELLNSYFSKNFGYSPDLYLAKYSQQDNTVLVQINYTVKDINEITSIDLLLDLHGGITNE